MECQATILALSESRAERI